MKQCNKLLTIRNIIRFHSKNKFIIYKKKKIMYGKWENFVIKQMEITFMLVVVSQQGIYTISENKQNFCIKNCLRYIN